MMGFRFRKVVANVNLILPRALFDVIKLALYCKFTNKPPSTSTCAPVT